MLQGVVGNLISMYFVNMDPTCAIEKKNLFCFDATNSVANRF